MLGADAFCFSSDSGSMKATSNLWNLSNNSNDADISFFTILGGGSFLLKSEESSRNLDKVMEEAFLEEKNARHNQKRNING